MKNLWFEGEVWHIAASIVFVLLWTKWTSVSRWVSEDSDDWTSTVIWLSSDSPNSASVVLFTRLLYWTFLRCYHRARQMKRWTDCTNSFVVNLWYLLDVELWMDFCWLFWNINETRMWADAQRDGRPAEYRRRPMFGWLPVSDIAAVTKARHKTRWNLLGYPNVANWSQPLVGRSSPYCGHICRRYWCLTSLYAIVDMCH